MDFRVLRRIREKKRNREDIWRYNSWKFPQLGKETDIHSHFIQDETVIWEHIKIISIKMAKIKDKDRILKASREMQLVISKGIPIKQLAVSVCLFVFWQKLCRTEGSGTIYLKSWKENEKLWLRILYMTRLSLRFEGEKMLKVFSTT